MIRRSPTRTHEPWLQLICEPTQTNQLDRPSSHYDRPSRLGRGWTAGELEGVYARGDIRGEAGGPAGSAGASEDRGISKEEAHRRLNDRIIERRTTVFILERLRGPGVRCQSGQQRWRSERSREQLAQATIWSWRRVAIAFVGDYCHGESRERMMYLAIRDMDRSRAAAQEGMGFCCRLGYPAEIRVCF